MRSKAFMDCFMKKCLRFFCSFCTPADNMHEMDKVTPASNFSRSIKCILCCLGCGLTMLLLFQVWIWPCTLHCLRYNLFQSKFSLLMFVMIILTPLVLIPVEGDPIWV
ncbi:unnamed protein product [Ixodes persulcatus]